MYEGCPIQLRIIITLYISIQRVVLQSSLAQFTVPEMKEDNLDTNLEQLINAQSIESYLLSERHADPPGPVFKRLFKVLREVGYSQLPALKKS